MKHGEGIWIKGNLQKHLYEGSYKNDHKHGYGVYEWPSGNIYKGNFENDE